jgi:CheY-like chemotaxis protein
VKEKKRAPIRILVADDHSEVLETVGPMLEPHFDVVGTASDGRAEMEAEKKLHSDVVVLDISMPVMSGIVVAMEMRKSGSKSSSSLPSINTQIYSPLRNEPAGWATSSRLAWGPT